MSNSILLVKLILLALCILGVVYFARNQNKETSVNIVQKPAGDAGLAAAKIQAQEEMDYFINFLAENSKDDKYKFSVKTALSDNQGTVEHMWVAITEYKDGTFFGTLANDPVEVKGMKFGGTVSVKKEDVEDWTLHDGYLNAIVGGFSLKEFKK